MTQVIKLDKKDIECITSVVRVAYPVVHAGQALRSDKNPNRKYKAEFIYETPITQDEPIIKCILAVAAANDPTYDPANWQRHVFGAFGPIKTLVDLRRVPEKYPAYVGKYFFSAAKTLSYKSAKMEGCDMTDPAKRKQFEEYVDAHAPKVRRFANPQLEDDLLAIQAINHDRVANGLEPHLPANFNKVMLPVKAHELWGGCYVRACVRAFWEGQHLKTVLLGLEQVLLHKEGDRLGGAETSPEEAFGEFAPPASLAPTPPQPFPFQVGSQPASDPFSGLV